MLLDVIKEKINDRGDLPFIDFMQIALYHPDGGYYTSSLPKLGKHGDFVTAPEISYLFGFSVANEIKNIIINLDNPVIFEFGAGTGKLCVDILTQLEKLNSLPEEYRILEVSGHLRAVQENLIKEKIPHLANLIKWETYWPEAPFTGVIIANEVLDAMPVNRFFKLSKALQESYITLNENNDLIEVFKDSNNVKLIQHVNRFLDNELENYKSEVNLFIDDWIAKCNEILAEGIMLLFDYGFANHEFYHPDRKEGTLMCHFQHKSHPNPLVNVGQQDITAHVNFTHVANAAFNVGFRVAGFTNQASFLINNNILDILLENKDETINSKQSLKKLLQANEMGELFKVIALTKNFDLELNGFKLNDKRASL
ncbi:MAG: hypothetical protein A3E88_02055 [Legionellales bacterium RIFCSPHIGHO2_12_FULL_35_11]|nr:MAG: hypothetical protein A3E88_02055 [Legionellales bacterium RIFCSPHIGHO2_12_FULL_35_11]